MYLTIWETKLGENVTGIASHILATPTFSSLFFDDMNC